MPQEPEELQKFNAAVRDPANFQKFAADPAGFAGGFGLKIAPDISNHIAGRLAGAKSLAEFDDPESGGGGSNFTAAVFAAGTITSTDTKIAAIAL